jgi:hypothetical protein
MGAARRPTIARPKQARVVAGTVMLKTARHATIGAFF